MNRQFFFIFIFIFFFTVALFPFIDTLENDSLADNIMSSTILVM